MKKLVALFGLLFVLSFNVFSSETDGVAVLGENPTEEQIQAVRNGARDFCSEIDDENQREVCVVNYYAQHNLEEEPSCD